MKVITIGRSSENDIVVDDFKVSRVHLQLVFNDGICSIVDLNSSNGTFVNGQKINGEVQLQPNDVVRIGNTTLPWQEYVNTHTTPTPPNIPTSPEPNKKTWLYVLIGVIALLLVCGGGFAIYYNNQQRVEKEQQELREQQENEQKQIQEKEKREQEIRDLRKKADQQFQNDLISQKDQLNEKVRDTEKERDDAKKLNEDLNKKLIDEQKSKDQLNEKVRDTEKERDDAKKLNDLMAEFIKESTNLSAIVAKQVCKELKCDLSNNADPKLVLNDKFISSNNCDKQKIISKIKTLKSKEKVVDSSKEKTDSVSANLKSTPQQDLRNDTTNANQPTDSISHE